MFSSNRKHSKLCTAECWRSATAVAGVFGYDVNVLGCGHVRNAEYRIEGSAVVVPQPL
jgi:hypothetical protein